MQIRTKLVLTGKQSDVDIAIQTLYGDNVVSKLWDTNVRGSWKEPDDNCLWFESQNEPPFRACKGIAEHCKKYRVSVIGMWAAAPPDRDVGYFWLDKDGKFTTGKADKDSVDTIFNTMSLWSERSVLPDGNDGDSEESQPTNDGEHEEIMDCFHCPDYETCQGNQGNLD